MRTVVSNGVVLDTSTMSMVGERDVVIEDGLIVDVTERYAGTADVELDASDRYVVPGLIDGHVHFRLATMDFRRLSSLTEVEFGIRMATLARETVERGFTTVRDLGGDVTGLMRAIAAGVAVGPRIVRAGRMLTQTGGHGDVEGGPRDVPECACSMRSTVFGVVADGPDAVRKAARHNLREGSDFLKVHVSGGVASPSDPLESLQYTADELEVAVVEAQHRDTYVAAHAYTPESIVQAVTAGVHTIEHGNLLNEDSAELMAVEGAVLVPTLATYHAMETRGAELGLPATNRRKNATVYEAGLASLDLARRAGVEMAYGTDLIGETQPMQNHELAIRSEVIPAPEILRSMWVTTARLCGLVPPSRERLLELGTETAADIDLDVCPAFQWK